MQSSLFEGILEEPGLTVVVRWLWLVPLSWFLSSSLLLVSNPLHSAIPTMPLNHFSQPLPIRTLLFSRLGGCLLHVQPHSSYTGVFPFKVEKIGFMLVSLQAQLTRQSSTFHRLRLLGHEIFSLRSELCILCFIVPSIFLESDHSIQGEMIQSIQLQMRSLMSSLHSLSSLSSYPSILQRMNVKHQSLLDEMSKNEGIKAQMEHKEANTTAMAGQSERDQNALNNTQTIPELRPFEATVRALTQPRSDDGNLARTCFQSVCGGEKVQQQDEGRVIAVMLMETQPTSFASSSSSNSPRILLSHIEPSARALNVAGPSNQALWKVVCAYATALSTEGTREKSPKPLSLLFPLFSPAALRVTFRCVNIPALNLKTTSAGVLVAYELAPPPLIQKRGVHPGAEWLLQLQSHQTENSASEPLIDPTSEVAKELSRFPQTYGVSREEEHHWRTPQSTHQGEEEKQPFSSPPRSVWSRLKSTEALLIDVLTAPPEEVQSSLAPPVTATTIVVASPSPLSAPQEDPKFSPLQSSPSSIESLFDSPSGALSPSIASPPQLVESPQSSDLASPVLLSPLQLLDSPLASDASSSLLASPQATASPMNASPDSIAPIATSEFVALHPMPPAAPRPVATGTQQPLDLGTGSFHKRRMHAASIVPAGPAVMQPQGEMNGLKPHPPPMPKQPITAESEGPLSNELPPPVAPETLAPLSRQGSFNKHALVARLPNTGSTVAAAVSEPIELTMDTPRLSTEASLTSRQAQRPLTDAPSIFPPIERRTSGTNITEKLQQANALAASLSATAAKSDTAF